MIKQLSSARSQVMGCDSETQRLRKRVLWTLAGLFAVGALASVFGGRTAPLFFAAMLVIVLLLVMVAIGEREDRRWLLLTLGTVICAGLLFGREAFPVGLWHVIEDVVGPHGTILRQMESTWR